ncbi:hypothetical protein ON010_g15264 [Phytophthora cinnamomi]|nr:hypothetical protein ON010_g15264 [Phytophthora cinnamomi]
MQERRHNCDNAHPAVILDAVSVRNVEELHPHAVARGRQEEEGHVIDAHEAESERDHLQIRAEVQVGAAGLHSLHASSVEVLEHVDVASDEESEEEELAQTLAHHAAHDSRLEPQESCQVQNVARRDATHVKVAEELEENDGHSHRDEAEEEEEHRTHHF